MLHLQQTTTRISSTAMKVLLSSTAPHRVSVSPSRFGIGRRFVHPRQRQLPAVRTVVLSSLNSGTSGGTSRLDSYFDANTTLSKVNRVLHRTREVIRISTGNVSLLFVW